MDADKTGALLRSLRQEKHLTQLQVAERLHLSDRTISKWERGQGCPDVSLLPALSDIFGVNIEALLAGDLSPKRADGGNMRCLTFYICPTCGNILTATSRSELSCCGRKLKPLSARPADSGHRLTIEPNDGESYITFSHPMKKEHYLSFIAVVSWDRVLLMHLYPEQSGEVRLPALRKGSTLYFCCSQDGLFVQ